MSTGYPAEDWDDNHKSQDLLNGTNPTAKLPPQSGIAQAVQGVLILEGISMP
jgi:hypothetical protein